jgi:hypothetical protein
MMKRICHDTQKNLRPINYLGIKGKEPNCIEGEEKLQINKHRLPWH